MANGLHRRQFLRATSAFVAALHAPLTLQSEPGATGDPRLLHVQLQGNKLEELRRFYQRTIGLPLSNDGNAGFTLSAGASTLRFTAAPAKAEPFYHFAFNIPENQFAAAKAWLAKRTPLLSDSATGKDEVYFAAWDAHAVYFRDPAGNIGELIARHRLKNRHEGVFSEERLLCVSEIGIVADDAKTLGGTLATKLAWPKSGNELVFVGAGPAYLILAPTGRPWLPDRIQKAVAAPVEVKVNQLLMEPLLLEKQQLRLTGR